jgi:RNA polymerase sigma-70 factor (ECF subfamily)
MVAAATTWPTSGVPDNPAGWLVTTGRRKAIDRIRSVAASERRGRVWGELAVAWDIGDGSGPIADDRLRLIFTCCHPALSLEAQVALTLRTLGGLTTEEVAKAFLISETALAQRIVRAKRKIRSAGIAYRVPAASELSDRLAAVLAVIYLIFNAGYLAHSGTDLVKVDLCDEALRLVHMVIELLPDDPEPLSLAAMMQFQDGRRAARVDVDGVPLTLEEQDRSTWDGQKVVAGLDLLARAQAAGRLGPYGLKASISALHAAAPGPELTDWATIVRLYDQLLPWEPTAVVRLNRAVAVAMSESIEAGLALVDDPGLAHELADYHLYQATRADLLRRSGRTDEAVVAYRRARAQTGNAAEHRFIDRRLEQLVGPSAPDRNGGG